MNPALWCLMLLVVPAQLSSAYYLPSPETPFQRLMGKTHPCPARTPRTQAVVRALWLTSPAFGPGASAADAHTIRLAAGLSSFTVAITATGVSFSVIQTTRASSVIGTVDIPSIASDNPFRIFPLIEGWFVTPPDIKKAFDTFYRALIERFSEDNSHEYPHDTAVLAALSLTHDELREKIERAYRRCFPT